jgi:hypothetical protein
MSLNASLALPAGGQTGGFCSRAVRDGCVVVVQTVWSLLQHFQRVGLADHVERVLVV